MIRRFNLPGLFLVASLLITGLLLFRNIIISDTAVDMLPSKAVRGDFQLLQQLGMVDKIFICLNIEEDEKLTEQQIFLRLTQSVHQLADRLKASDQFSSLLYRLPQSNETSLFTLFHTHMPALLDQQDYQSLQSIISASGIERAMAANFVRLNSLAGFGSQKQVIHDPLHLHNLILDKLKYLKNSFSLTVEDGYFLSEDGKSILLLGVSNHQLIDGNNAELIQKIIDDGLADSLEPGVTSRVIGTLPHTLANRDSIRRDLRTLIPIATCFLLLLLIAGLRSLNGLLVCAIPFLAAPFAISITSLIHGRIGGLAIGFGIVLIGIAVDFAIHLYLALRYEAGPRSDILHRITKPILMAVLTTSSVFIVLLFSQIPSHKQMATLALFGVVTAVLFSYQIIPPIVTGGKKFSQPDFFVKLQSVSLQPYTRPVLLIWLLFVIIGLFCWSGLKYRGDLQAFDIKEPSIIEDERYFKTTWKQQGEQGFLVARGKNLDEALARNSTIYTLLRQHDFEFQSIAPLLPHSEFQSKNLATWKSFWEKELPSFKNRFSEQAKRQGFALQAFTPFFSWLNSKAKPITIDSYKNSSLQPIIFSMIKEVNPKDLQESSSSFLISTNLDTSGGLSTPLLDLDRLDGITLISNSKWRKTIERLLKQDIIRLTLGAGCLILIIVVFIFRTTRKVIGVLAPVLSALSSMAIFSYIDGAELNMMHLLMGIMIIGLSVDYGIFMVCSLEGKSSSVSPVAVSICAASSLIGFGVLCFAQHPALYSLGKTVLMGIGAAWPTAVWITPCILGFPPSARKLS